MYKPGKQNLNADALSRIPYLDESSNSRNPFAETNVAFSSSRVFAVTRAQAKSGQDGALHKTKPPKVSCEQDSTQTEKEDTSIFLTDPKDIQEIMRQFQDRYAASYKRLRTLLPKMSDE